jgi:hypothetical protein
MKFKKLTQLMNDGVIQNLPKDRISKYDTKSNSYKSDELQRESIGNHIDNMDPDIYEAISMLARAWRNYKNGQLTESKNVVPAKKELLTYIVNKLK